MTQVADLLAGLNPAQREAVEAVDGPLLIVAGPGSGKTRVITHRIAYLVRECGVSPHSILAMTFTNKAAREMRERLFRLAGPHGDALTVGTFHSFCARLLRREGEFLGLSRNYSIFDDDDQIAAVRQCLRESESYTEYRPRDVLAAISRAKSKLSDSDVRIPVTQGDDFGEVVDRVRPHYEEILKRNNAVDFDDLLIRTVELFDRFPDVLRIQQERYTYLMVDEFQDTNEVQYHLVRKLAEGRENLCVIGDPNQSIYSWRSADVRNILNFESDYPKAKVIRMGQNYRSFQNILDVAQNLISTNGQHIGLFAQKGEGVGRLVKEVKAENEEQETNWVMEEIKRLVREGEFKAGDCAVLYRVNAQANALQKACTKHQIKYRLVGGTPLYRRLEVKSLIAYLRLLYNEQDNVNLSTLISDQFVKEALHISGVVPKGTLGNESIRKLDEWATGQGLSTFEAMREIAVANIAGLRCTAPLNARAKASITRFACMIDWLMGHSQKVEIVVLIALLLEVSGLRKHIQNGDDRSIEREENVKAFCAIAQEFNSKPPSDGLEALLEHTALVSQVDELEDADDSVTLITLHQAKGLEFPVVFIVGLEEGLLPHSRSMDNEEQLEEERRLCYVGMTRAKDRLYLLWSIQQRPYLQGTFRRSDANNLHYSNFYKKSQFLREIEREHPELVELVSVAEEGAASDTGARVRDRRSMFSADRTRGSTSRPVRHNGDSERRNSVPTRRIGDRVRTKFTAGDRVRHPNHGEGFVTDVYELTSGALITVEFTDAGTQKLPATRLEKLSE